MAGASDEAFAAVVQGQAAFCRAAGASFSAAVLEAAEADRAAGGAFALLLAPWDGADAATLLADAVWLRLLGALHDLVLSGAAPALAAAYPPNLPPDAVELRGIVAAAATEQGAAIAAMLRSPPQTNEVRRAVALQAGFREVAALTGLPLATLEIGASAGLLQHWDAFAYAARDGAWRRGPADAPLTLDTDWSGPPPADAPVAVASRAACDIAPIDLADPVALRRLCAYIWADQGERLERLRIAAAAATARGVVVERADAADWLPGRLTPRPGVATVLYHSVMFQYVPAPSREPILRTLLAAAARATPDGPLAWLRLEPAPGALAARMELTLTLWPGGGARVLAQVHPHGASVDWASVDWASADWNGASNRGA